VARNAPCPCGSGRRYKDCHGRLDAGAASARAAPGEAQASGGARALHDLLNRALAAQTAGRAAEAETLYRDALAQDPRHFDALHMLGVLRYRAGDIDEAIALIRAAIDVDASHAPAHSNLALALTAKHAYPEALASVDRALARAPSHPDALNNRGLVLQAQGRHAEALQCFDAALAHAPDHPRILSNRANALLELRRHEEAAQAFARLVAIAPDHPWALGYLYQTRMHCCDWSGIDALAAQIHAAVRAGKRAISPFMYLAMSASPADQLACARITAAAHARTQPLPPRGARSAHGRIRLAYLSANFHEHPSSYAEARLFETHDRQRFEVTAISFGPDTGTPLRRRLERAFDHFIDVRAQSDADVAALMRTRGIDIAVDLMGYQNHSRPGLYAFRAAPVQVSYHGYPGTLGTAWFDYLFADARVLPPGEEIDYAEQVVRLPDTYLAHDPTRAIAGPQVRADAGLPEDAFVFCSFNNNYKIMPATFDVWMRIVARVPGSVLWLAAPDDAARRNLRSEATRRGVDPARLVFAERVPAMEAHLARHRLADLSLDTHYYNAHTTATDALWAGLPLLTYTGSTLASRAATSILHAIGLPELIARDPEDFEARAVALATSPALLREIRDKLARHRDTFPLFDLPRYRAAIESAYQAMWARSVAGLPPAAFDVRPEGRIELRD